MRSRSVLALLACVIAGCSTPDTQNPPETDTENAADVRLGPFTRSASEADLIAAFGASNVVRSEVALYAGRCAPGSVLFSGTPDQVDVIWADSSYTRPAQARFSSPGSRWRASSDLHVGMSLEALVEANEGEPVTFAGFGWEDGGLGIWPQSPSNTQAGRLVFELAPDSASYAEAVKSSRFDSVIGPQEVLSDNPALEGMSIHVARLTLYWREPDIQWSCQ